MTGVHFQFFIDVVIFQLIESKSKLVVWVPGLKNHGPVISKNLVLFHFGSSIWEYYESWGSSNKQS